MAIVGEAHIVVKAITTGFKSEVEKAVNGIDLTPQGSELGEDLDSGVRDGVKRNKKPYFSEKFKKEAKAAAGVFSKLVNTGTFMGPSLSTAVSAMSSLVSGAYALGSAIGAALPAAAALGQMLSAAAQAMITVKMAFKGFGKATAALRNSDNGAGGGNNDAAVADARRRLAQIYQRADEAMAAANDKVRKSQIALNQAYLKGAESLQQLGFDAEDAALAQDKAAIELERARETLMRAQSLPVDDRSRREAELAFKEAELNYRKTKDQVNDLAKQQEYAAATGIEGTEEVLKAKEDLAEAEADRAKQQRDNNQDILEGQMAIEKAINSANSSSTTTTNALKDLSKEAEEFAKYWVSLDPEFKKLRASAGKDLFPKLKEAMEPIVKKIFPALRPILRATGGAMGDFAKAISNVLTSADSLSKIKLIGQSNVNIIKTLTPAFAAIVKAIVNILDAARPLTEEFAKWITLKVTAFSDITGDSDRMSGAMTKASDIIKILGGLFGYLGRALKNIGGAAFGSGKGLLKFFEEGAAKFEDWTKKAAGDGSLEKYFEGVAYNVKMIWKFISAVVKEFAKLGGDKNVGKTFEKITPAAKAFGRIGKILNEVGPILGDFVGEFATLSEIFTDSGSMKIYIGILTEALKIVNLIFNNSVMKSVLAVAASIFAVTRAFGTMYKIMQFGGKVLMGNIFKLFGIRSSAENAAIATRKLEFAEKRQALAAKLAAAKAKAQLAAEKLLNGAKKLGATLSEKLRISTIKESAAKAAAAAKTKLQVIWERILTGVKKVGIAIQTAFNAVMAMNPITLIVIAVVALIALMVVLYKKNENFRKIIDSIGEKVKEIFGKILEIIGGVIDWVKTNWPLLLAILTGPFGLLVLAISKNWDKIVEFVKIAIDKIKEIGANIWNWIVDKIKIVWDAYVAFWSTIFTWIGKLGGKLAEIGKGIWNWIVDTFKTRWENLKTNFGKIIEFVKGLGRKISEAASGMWDGLKNGLGTVLGFINKGINVILRGVNKLIDGINNVNPMSDIPRIPLLPEVVKLARGGVVRPTSGGTMALIGEAGRPERVEPLDAQGLSQRDRAIIAELSGVNGRGSGGDTYNVYPAAKMNEEELAAMVSRRVAWNKMRGAY